MIGEAEVLRPLVEECLDDDPAVRPIIATVCERILVNKDAYMKEPPQDVITFHCELRKKDDELKKKDHEIECLRSDIKQLSSENEQQRVKLKQMV